MICVFDKLYLCRVWSSVGINTTAQIVLGSESHARIQIPLDLASVFFLTFPHYRTLAVHAHAKYARNYYAEICTCTTFL